VNSAKFHVCLSFLSQDLSSGPPGSEEIALPATLLCTTTYCIYVNTHVFGFIYMYMHIYLDICTCIYICLKKNAFEYIYKHILIDICICVCICVHLYRYMYL